MVLENFTVKSWQEGKWWIALAVDVNVASQGRSREEAHRNLLEALELYFEPNLPIGLDIR